MRKDRGKEVSQKKKGKGKGKKKEEGEEEEEEKEYIPVPLNLVLPQAPELPFNINLRLQLFGWIQERWPELISYDPTKGRYGMFVDQNAVIETSERLKARLERVTERAAAKKEKRDAAKAETKEHLRRQAEENGEEFDSEDSVSTVEGEESTSEESDGSVYWAVTYVFVKEDLEMQILSLNKLSIYKSYKAWVWDSVSYYDQVSSY